MKKIIASLIFGILITNIFWAMHCQHLEQVIQVQKISLYKGRDK
jgi:hypothetical protein